MPPNVPEQLSKTIETLYRSESGGILATLVRLLGDLDLAEEAMHEAFAAALDTWHQAGIPDSPRPWLISTARFKAIDGIRRRARFDAAQTDLALYLETRINEEPEEEEIEDDRLRLIFTCCHPVLAPEGQVALTLREVCGLTTEDIARAFLVTPATLAQRIVRAKAIIRDKTIPYQVPSPQELPERLGAVLQVVYLVFNEGYSAEAILLVQKDEISLRRASSGTRSNGPARAHVAAGVAPRRPKLSGGRSHPSGPAGSLFVEPRPDRRRHCANRERSCIAPFRRLYAAGRHCCGSRRSSIRSIYRLAADRGTLRPADSYLAISGRGTQPRRCRRHVRASREGSCSHRCLAGARRTRQLSSRALRPGGIVSPAVSACGSLCFL